MVTTTDQEINSRREVDESPPFDNHDSNKNHHPFTSLGRQSSIYSLTLDEFQHTLCESGKNFGSMNMDEFLNSIWTAEENQSIHNNSNLAAMSLSGHDNSHHNGDPAGLSGGPGRGMISKQASLPRQGSLSLPDKLCRKTVEEVWSEIHNGRVNKGQQEAAAVAVGKSEGNSNSSRGNVGNSESTPRQPTFGEMTLEDFLVKAGVIREQQCGSVAVVAAGPPLLPPQQQYGMQQSAAASNGGAVVAAGFVPRPIGNSRGVGYQQSILPQTGGPPPPLASVYGGNVGNGGGGSGYAPRLAQQLTIAGPVSPVSSDGMVANADAVGDQFGMDVSGLRGHKRVIDGPVEKVVERRQRRMIKNRESAARSRARKQAYTVELEAELNQLKEENKQLRQALVELERKRKQQYVEELRTKGQSKAQKARERLRLMRRNLSCSL